MVLGGVGAVPGAVVGYWLNHRPVDVARGVAVVLLAWALSLGLFFALNGASFQDEFATADSPHRYASVQHVSSMAVAAALIAIIAYNAGNRLWRPLPPTPQIS